MGENSNHAAEAEGLVKAFKGRGDRGAIVTLLGLLTNIGLTAVKGGAGWYLNSAVLIADAGHSLSDLMGDFVTLFFYTFSRRPPSKSYPYGYGKFESLGTSIVAVFLLLGAYAIGAHSYSLLEQAAPSLPFSIPFIPSSRSPTHTPSDSLPDLNAAWIAVFSIIVKESIYRITASVARSENSPVLLANALHHRSDMYSSFVSLAAILGNWFLPSWPLDPFGGLLVTLLILHQAFELLGTSLSELTDRGVSPSTIESISSLISKEIASSAIPALTANPVPSDVRGIRRGAHLFIDTRVDVLFSETGEGNEMTVGEAVVFEDAVARNVRSAWKEVKEIRIQFIPVSR